MVYVIKFLYSFFLPPGIFIILLWLMAFWLLRLQRRAAGKLILGFSLVYYIVSTSWFGEVVLHQLEYQYTPVKNMKGDVIVMLGGGGVLAPDSQGKSGMLTGASSNRMITAVQLYKKSNLPIIVSGGQVYPDTGNEGEITRKLLIDLGVPSEKIIVDNKSLNTEQNAVFTKKLMKEHDFHQPILITSAFHMKRSILCFEKVGVEVQPLPTDYRTSEKLTIYGNKFAPGDFEMIHLAAKEYLGILAIKIKTI